MRSSNICLDLVWMPWLLRLVRLACTVLCFLPAAEAIDPNRDISQYIRQRWGPEQGFPGGAVHSITQTTDGYLWIGTDSGLVRFDGVNFRLIREPGQFGEGSGPVLGLVAGDDAKLFMRLRGPTLLLYQQGAVKDVVDGFSLSQISAGVMCPSKGGPLFFSRDDSRAYTYRGKSFQQTAIAPVMSRSPVISVAATPKGEIWMGTRDAGVFRWNNGQTSQITKGLPDLKVNCVLSQGEQDVWVGTDSGIARWNGTELVSSVPKAMLDKVQVLALAGDRDRNVWVGTHSRGLLRVNDEGVAAFDEDSQNAEAVTAIFEDREGTLWVGRASGLECLRDSQFVTYSVPQGLPADKNGPLYIDPQGRTWFAPVNGGLYWLKDQQVERVTEAGLADDVIYSIAGRGSDLWIGRQRGGLTLLRDQAGSLAAKTYTERDGLAQNSVYAVHQSSDGSVWAGTLSGGVSRFDGRRFTTYQSKDGLASNTVSAIAEGADGTMWFATPNGLSSFSHEHWRNYSGRDGLPSDSVNSLLQDSSGLLWLGTNSGLACLRSNRIIVPDHLPAVLKEQVVGIAEDRAGSLWITTLRHVLQVNRDKLLRGVLDESDVKEYGAADGLISTIGVKRHRSVVSGPFGRIWLSLNRGISVVDPARVARTSAPALVHVQAVAADGKALGIEGPVRIPPGSQRVTFTYSGLILSLPERVRYRYRLDNFDHNWSEPKSTTEAVYTNLAPGAYRFRVMASNRDGFWNGAEAAINFQVQPSIWNRWWFRLAAVFAFGLGALALYRYRLHQLTRQLNVRFEERLAERTRIAQDLHDTLLQGFVSASMQLHVAADRLPEDSPVKPQVGRVLQLMGQVIEEGRNAVRGLRSTTTGPGDLEEAFSRVQREVPMREDATVRILVEGRARPLHPIIRDEVYRIGREALVNAFRHSGASSIELELEYAANSLRMLVRDNGRGVDTQILRSGREGHWGLSGMRERAERVGARLTLWSRHGAGTEIELSVPGHVAYQSPAVNGARGWLAKWNWKRLPMAAERIRRDNERND